MLHYEIPYACFAADSGEGRKPTKAVVTRLAELPHHDISVIDLKNPKDIRSLRDQ